MMPKSNGYTRQEILHQIKLHGSMTAESLGSSLGISPVAVRQHLSSLLAEQLVTAAVERRPVGRPVNRFSLTEQGDESFPRAYELLAADVLEEVRSAHGDIGVQGVFARRRDRAVRKHSPEMAGCSLEQKVDTLVRIQTDAGFMAKRCGVEDGVALVQHNCSICYVASRFHNACDAELQLFQMLAGPEVEVERTSHIPSGDHCCTFIFREVLTTEL